jgi:hypothetical protein
MDTQTITIEIDSATAALLQNKAAAHGLPLAALLKQFAESINAPSPIEEPVASEVALEEFMHAMESLADDNIEPLSRDFSREDIYFPEA